MSSSPQHQVYQVTPQTASMASSHDVRFSLTQVEHLATFSTASPQQQPTTPKMALQRLFAMEKTSGIWTQRMAIQVEGKRANRRKEGGEGRCKKFVSQSEQSNRQKCVCILLVTMSLLRHCFVEYSFNLFPPFHVLGKQTPGRDMKIIDGDSGEAVERFPVTLIQQPTAFNHNTHIYDNILIFTVQHPEEAQGNH